MIDCYDAPDGSESRCCMSRVPCCTMRGMTTPRRIQAVFAMLLALVAAMSGWAGWAAASPQTPVIHTAAQAVLTSLTVNGPVLVKADGAHPPVLVRGNANYNGNLLEVKDYLDQPIAGVSSAGGLWVAGDDFRVFGSDIFNATITLHSNGSITLGGPTGPTVYGGSADPNVAPPCAPCHSGDRYFRTNGDTLVYLGGLWVIR